MGGLWVLSTAGNCGEGLPLGCLEAGAVTSGAGGWLRKRRTGWGSTTLDGWRLAVGSRVGWHSLSVSWGWPSS